MQVFDQVRFYLHDGVDEKVRSAIIKHGGVILDAPVDECYVVIPGKNQKMSSEKWLKEIPKMEKDERDKHWVLSGWVEECVKKKKLLTPIPIGFSAKRPPNEDELKEEKEQEEKRKAEEIEIQKQKHEEERKRRVVKEEAKKKETSSSSSSILVVSDVDEDDDHSQKERKLSREGDDGKKKKKKKHYVSDDDESDSSDDDGKQASNPHYLPDEIEIIEQCMMNNKHLVKSRCYKMIAEKIKNDGELGHRNLRSIIAKIK